MLKVYIWRAPAGRHGDDVWHWDVAPADRREPDAYGYRRPVPQIHPDQLGIPGL